MSWIARSYEAVLYAGLSNYRKTGNNNVFLTLLGGGVFGNRPEWIIGAIGRSLEIFRNAGLAVSLVSYQHSNPDMGKLLASYP